MITSTDILHLPYTFDLTEGGIAYACQSLATSSILKKENAIDDLPQLIAETAVELAFRRCLESQHIPFHTKWGTPFIRPPNFHVSLGGHSCELNCSLITRRSRISQLRKEPGVALETCAMLPVDQFSREGQKDDDIHIFSFLLGLVALRRGEMDKAATAGQPVCAIHTLSEGWSSPAVWKPHEGLVLKSECRVPIHIELGGVNSERVFCTTKLELQPKKRVVVEQCFNTVAYLKASRRPENRIGWHCPTCRQTLIILPTEWDNIWVYGMEILLMGWLSHEEYRHKAKVLNAGMQSFQVERTREKYLVVPMDELNPLRPLFKRTQAWAANSRVS